jgi:adenine-specific DNA-methyltransferase
MATLNWIGKQAVVNHDKDVPFKLLKKIKSASVGDNSQNLILHGDNLEALKALMPYYTGKVDCIYIDPPYNTGNEKWVYNDKVNSPKIKKWLGKVVGKENEDLTRHDKWLCMMYPRLSLLRDLMSDEGALFVSIDDDEGQYLKVLLDEIFGRENFLTTIVWQKKHTSANDARFFSDNHDYILVFVKDVNKFNINLLPREDVHDARYTNADNDSRGPWASGPCHVKTPNPKDIYEITTPSGRKVWPPRGTSWRFSERKFEELVRENRVWFGKTGNNIPRYKRFLTDVQQGIIPKTLWLRDEVGDNQEAKTEVKNLLSSSPFNTPKPTRLIKRILRLSTNKDSIVLDSFAGSGSTGHAVLDLNHEDGGNRKFIIVEMEDEVAKDVTAKRVEQAIKQNKYKAGFEYCELDKPLFNEAGQIENTCDFNQFATYIYFTETQTNIDKNKISSNFIGECDETEYYLIYKEKDANVLDKSFLKKIRNTDNRKIVYADRCLLDDDTLEKNGVVFKQIPYEVKIY